METQVKHIKLTVLLLEFGGKTVLICSCMKRRESDGCFSWSLMRRSCLLVLHTGRHVSALVIDDQLAVCFDSLLVGGEKKKKLFSGPSVSPGDAA